MTSGQKRILIVDDSPDDINFVMESFSEQYLVLAATSGEDALEMVRKEQVPNVIIMDVEMPGMNGYQTCHQLKNNPDTASIDVIFLSAHDTLDQVLSGFDSGGCDYLTKPVQPELLRQKVSLAMTNREKLNEFNSKFESTKDVAMTALTNAGELGVVVNFMQASYEVMDPQALADMVIGACSRYSLDSGVLLSTLAGPVYASSRPLQPLEMELLARCQGGQRITQRGKRLILNSGASTLLIKNLPDDDELAGRLRDHLITLLSGAEARLNSLEVYAENKSIINDVNKTLNDIDGQHKEQMQSSLDIMDNLMQDLHELFMTFGLTEQQEEQIIRVVNESVDRSINVVDKGFKIDQEMRSVLERLHRITTLNRERSAN